MITGDSRGGDMRPSKVARSSSGVDVVYVDHSTSGIAASTCQSSADPTNLASIMRQSPIVLRIGQVADAVISGDTTGTERSKPPGD